MANEQEEMMRLTAGWMIATAATLGLVASDVSAQPRPRGGPDVWVRLGCQSVGFTVDRDVIRVGRREGRFKAIRLIASGNRVQMIDLKVIYANGEPDDIPVRSELRALDLRGRERAIDRIELIYRTEPNLRGRAEVCVDALD
jgi:hypothetical protein